mmetsp:Transcript_5409/g.6176  ORF Transcript_5409/g.6176 Transcript_5409/m.6176 type:complete len:101 (+) Transcript_5409:227-529(+)
MHTTRDCRLKCKIGISLLKTNGASDISRAEVFAAMAQSFEKTYDYKMAVKWYQKALTFFLEKYSGENLTVALICQRIGVVYLYFEKLDLSSKHFVESLCI